MVNSNRTNLAQKLVEITPGSHEKKVYYGTTGGEAVEASMKLARYYTGRHNIMAFHGAYHGRTFGAATATCDAHHRHYQGFPSILGVAHVPYAYCYRCIYNLEYPECDMQCTRFIEELFRSGKYGFRDPESNVTNVSAILVEPMIGAGGGIIPPKEFLQDLRRIADDYSLLLIADEVQMGMGRTGKWWGCDHSDVVPDILTIGKTIGGGIPISAVIAKAEIMDEWGPAAHGTTFGGTPLGCAAGLAVMEVFEKEKVVSRAARMGEYFLKGLNDLAEKHPLIGGVDGRGMELSFELVKDQKTKEPAIEEVELLHKECYDRGVLYIRRGGFYGSRVTLLPSLLIEKEQIDRVIEVFDEGLKVLEKIK
jgi:4-aminobutyrate aminotransferase-like enzyme